jgi:cytochrome P450
MTRSLNAKVVNHPAAAFTKSAWTTVRRPRRRPPPARGKLGTPFNPLDPVTISDPPAVYRRLHAQPGVHPIGRGVYALASHHDVRAAVAAPDVLVSGTGVTAQFAPLPMLLTCDRPHHSELRHLLSPHFTAARSGAMEPAMREVAGRAVDRMLGHPGSDAVAELAVPLPMTVIARLIGVPDDDLDRLHRWSDGIVEGFNADRSFAGAVHAASAIRSTFALHRYMLAAFARLRREPGNDVISALLTSREAGHLRDDELFWLALMLIVAGNETTTNLIASMLLALARDPEAYRRLRAERDLIGPAVEEAARWGSPIQGLYRAAAADYVVGETAIPAGARVLLLFGAANRDPRVYAEPDRYVVDRAPSNHLGFGAGIHYCLGAHLARVEARVALEEVLDRVAEIELAGPVAWRSNPSVHGPGRLPLRLRAA